MSTGPAPFPHTCSQCDFEYTDEIKAILESLNEMADRQAEEEQTRRQEEKFKEGKESRSSPNKEEERKKKNRYAAGKSKLKSTYYKDQLEKRMGVTLVMNHDCQHQVSTLKKELTLANTRCEGLEKKNRELEKQKKDPKDVLSKLQEEHVRVRTDGRGMECSTKSIPLRSSEEITCNPNSFNSPVDTQHRKRQNQNTSQDSIGPSPSNECEVCDTSECFRMDYDYFNNNGNPMLSPFQSPSVGGREQKEESTDSLQDHIKTLLQFGKSTDEGDSSLSNRGQDTLWNGLSSSVNDLQEDIATDVENYKEHSRSPLRCAPMEGIERSSPLPPKSKEVPPLSLPPSASHSVPQGN